MKKNLSERKENTHEKINQNYGVRPSLKLYL